MRVFFVRHGETVQNQDGIIQGQMPGKLSDRGISQVRKTARELAGIDFKASYSSDLHRCKETTELLANANSTIKDVVYDERLRETNFGDWQGLHKSERDWSKSFSEKDNDSLHHRTPPNGESISQHHARIIDFLNEITPKHSEHDQILVVSHNGTMRLVFAAYYKVPTPNLLHINITNAGIVTLDITDQNLALLDDNWNT